MSIDSASGNSTTREDGATSTGPRTRRASGSSTSPTAPTRSSPTSSRPPCGSHTNIDVRRARARLVYVQSYPASTSGACPSAHGIISVVDITDPAKAEIVSTPSVTPAVGCHDGAHPRPPRVHGVPDRRSGLGHHGPAEARDPVPHPRRTGCDLAFERRPPTTARPSPSASSPSRGATARATARSKGPLGAIWFYDVSDPTAPVQLSYFTPPRPSMPGHLHRSQLHGGAERPAATCSSPPGTRAA